MLLLLPIEHKSWTYYCIKLFHFSNVIDVGALDSHNLEQHEYMDRSRAYSKRIEGGGIKVPDSTCCLLKDIPAPEKILAADPLAAGDHGLVKIHTSMCYRTLYCLLNVSNVS